MLIHNNRMIKIAVTGSGSRHVYVILWIEIVKGANCIWHFAKLSSYSSILCIYSI